MDAKERYGINLLPANSGMRKVCELLSTHGPMYTGSVMLEFPAMSYDSLKKYLARLEHKKAIVVTRGSKPYRYAATSDWREILDAEIKHQPIKKLPHRIPKPHYLIAAWMAGHQPQAGSATC